MAKLRNNHSRRNNPFVGMTFKVLFMMAITAILFYMGYKGYNDAQDGRTEPQSFNEVVFDDYNRDHLIPSTERSDIEIVHHTYYSLGYVEKYEQAAWVCYVLNKSELVIPNVKRHDRFLVDPKIEGGSANYYDYRGSGYSRGHMAPAGDMAFNEEAMRESFYMSNMSPQLIPFNGGIWRELEETVRDWAYKNERLYVVTGPVLNNVKEYIGQKNKVAVPTQYYKAVIDIEGPEKKGIAFIMENKKSSKPIMEYAVTIDELENSIKMNLFDELLDEDIVRSIESTIDKDLWPVSQKRYQNRLNEWNHY